MPKLITYKHTILTKYRVATTKYEHAIVNDLALFMLKRKADRTDFAILNIAEITQEEADAIAEVFNV